MVHPIFLIFINSSKSYNHKSLWPFIMVFSSCQHEKICLKISLVYTSVRDFFDFITTSNFGFKKIQWTNEFLERTNKTSIT
jgi:hypothetical protein